MEAEVEGWERQMDGFDEDIKFLVKKYFKLPNALNPVDWDQPTARAWQLAAQGPDLNAQLQSARGVEEAAYQAYLRVHTEWKVASAEYFRRLQDYAGTRCLHDAQSKFKRLMLSFGNVSSLIYGHNLLLDAPNRTLRLNHKNEAHAEMMRDLSLWQAAVQEVENDYWIHAVVNIQAELNITPVVQSTVHVDKPATGDNKADLDRKIAQIAKLEAEFWWSEENYHKHCLVFEFDEAVANELAD